MRYLFAFTVTTAALAAQNVPLKNWAAPLYWQPSPAEIETSPLRADIRKPTPDATTPAGSLVFVAMTPCRVVDTRNNCTVNPSLCTNAQFGPPSLSTNATRSFPLQLSPTCTIPSNAMAYSFNVTMIPNPTGGFAGYVSVWNTAAPPNTPPTAATILDFPSGDIRSNAAIVPAGINNGSVSAITNATNPLDMVIDINGYYAPSTGITLGQGTVSAPSLSFAGDAGTGMYSSGIGSLSLTTGGAAALTVDSTRDVELAGSLRKGGNLFLHNLGTANLGLGLNALSANTTGQSNTANGYYALSANKTGYQNTAHGYIALGANTAGIDNTASGAYALSSNSNGNNNTANGYAALDRNTTGFDNSAYGYGALFSNTTGIENTAVGYDALDLATGNNNTALGSSAGANITTGSNNIDIGNPGTASDGTSANSGVIRIGTSGTQTSFFAAGITGAVSNPATVVINTMTGQLGIGAPSSRRYKKDIQDMDDASRGLLQLRPVTFRYKQPYADGSQPLDYGLIAEEVAEVFPGLVDRNPDGQIETVQYHKLIPMLLNELQKLKAEVAELRENR